MIKWLINFFTGVTKASSKLNKSIYNIKNKYGNVKDKEVADQMVDELRREVMIASMYIKNDDIRDSWLQGVLEGILIGIEKERNTTGMNT